MTDDSKPSSGILDKITGRIGKIVTLCVTIGALGAAVIQLRGVGKSIVDSFSPAKETASFDLQDCFKAKLSHPETVSLKQWSSMKLRLTGRNDCKTSLLVCVALHGGGDGIRIEPLFAASDPLCWQKETLASGPIDWPVIPPRLIPLNVPLGRPATVYINWVVSTAETKAQVHAAMASFSVEDDPPATNAGSVVPR
ncbi:MAG TPA: hypothetical protein VE078_04975 [Thermoanaerobaculia bacterium]|nr:hypothetical protein [Thermoanaerobaculia bacterium]